jgi:hypothetical protein
MASRLVELVKIVVHYVGVWMYCSALCSNFQTSYRTEKWYLHLFIYFIFGLLELGRKFENFNVHVVYTRLAHNAMHKSHCMTFEPRFSRGGNAHALINE